MSCHLEKLSSRTILPFTLLFWLLWLLYEIQRAGRGPSGYYPPNSTAFVIFSAICLPFALYHSFTFLKLAGVILRVSRARQVSADNRQRLIHHQWGAG